MRARLVKESLSIPDINDLSEEGKMEYCAKLISLLPKTNKSLRARFIAYALFELGNRVEYCLKSVKTNYALKGNKNILKEHILGKQKAGEIISKYVDKHGDIDADNLRMLMTTFVKYINIPRYDSKNKSINKSIDYLQNQQNLITYDEYVGALNKFHVETDQGVKPLQITEGKEELAEYFRKANDFIEKYIK